MKTTRLLMLCGVVALSGATTRARSEAQVHPVPAAQLLASAQKQAAGEHKNVLVMFHSSWCGWCKRLAGVMDKPEFKPLFTQNYVVVSLDVSENGPQKKLENPGADKVMADLGGAHSGLPFYAFVDASGTPLANSIAVPDPGGTRENIGYPNTHVEIAAFNGLLEKTAPKMKFAARQNFIAYLTKTSPSRLQSAASGH